MLNVMHGALAGAAALVLGSATRLDGSADIDDGAGVVVPGVAGGEKRIVPKQQLCEILQPRAEELLVLVRDDLEKNGWDDTLRGGVVLTGGGAQLAGLLELTQQIFSATVRYGLPGRQVAAVVNFPPKQIGKFMSEVLVLGFPDGAGGTVLIAPDKEVPIGGRLY